MRYLVGYLKLNLAAALEYRASFIVQAGGMLLNDAAFFVFWVLFFNRFPSVGGWGIQDVAMLWAVAATAIGLSLAIFGNCARIATIVMDGQLDYYLGLPKEVLLHVLISRTGLAAWGDVSFGLLAFVIFGPHDALSIALYVVLVSASVVTFTAYMVIAGSLAFFVGSAESAAFQAQQALINFSLYPGGIFHGWLRVLLFTVIPAGLISHMPVEILHQFDPVRLVVVLAFGAGSAVLAFVVFGFGLRRYESGNLVVLRG